MPDTETAVVLGAAGFIGQHLARRLRETHRAVVGVGRGCALPRIDRDSLARIGGPIGLIVFCAGGSLVGRSFADPREDFAKSIPPLVDVLDFMRTSSPRSRLVFLSSAAVYGEAARLPTPEDHALAPISPYGHHKRIGEELCASYAATYGSNVAIIRFFSVYGPELRKQLFWDACVKATRGRHRFAGSGREVRDWLHVEDAIALIRAVGAVASPAAPIVNGGGGVGVRVGDVVSRIYDALAVDAQPEFDGSSRTGDPPSYIAATAAARALGWSPRVELERGIREYVDWFTRAAGDLAADATPTSAARRQSGS